MSGKKYQAPTQWTIKLSGSGCSKRDSRFGREFNEEHRSYLNFNLWIMEREGIYLFANLFSSKGNAEKVETSMDVTTTSSAQPHVLREKMREKELSHGETVTASISPVRLESAFGKMYLYFCPMQTLDILETISPGDGGEIPPNVLVEGLKIPKGNKSGLYTLKNVKLSSNGTMQVIANEKTTWEAYVES